MSAPAAAYRAMVEARQEQAARLLAPPGEDRWASRAAFFRLDPRREPDANLSAVLELLEPGDAVLDVGGGAGRVSLPAALRSREVVNVDPSPAMCQQFRESAAEAGIANARAVEAGWMDAHDEAGDVILCANVTYFVRDIAPFVAKLDAAARRLVVISAWSTPPPDRIGGLFEAVFGEPLAPTPGPRKLMSVLWELGIPPDMRVLPDAFGMRQQPPAMREEAVAFALRELAPRDPDFARARIESQFDALFAFDGAAYRPTWYPDAREVLITWAPRQRFPLG
jgi:SAM-dependent methyltransferase